MLSDIAYQLSTAADLSLTVHTPWIFHGGYAVLEALRVRASREGRSLQISPPAFGEVIGFNCVGRGGGGTIPLRHFEHLDPSTIGEFLMSGWAQRARHLSELQHEEMLDSVGEIFVNAFRHAKSDVGVIACGQYYPANGALHLSVVDLGIGIPRSLANASGCREDDIEPMRALAWAFEPGHSSIRAARGHGLAILRDFLRAQHAKLHVFSGRGYARLVGAHWEVRALAQRFPGTLIDIKLPTTGY